MPNDMPPLPEGFTLDNVPPLPEGFTLDGSEPEPKTKTESVFRRVMANYSPEAIRTGHEGIQRQAGLAGRAVLRGLAQTVEPLTNPVRNIINRTAGTNIPRLSDTASHVADVAGLPAPESDLERGVQTAGEIATGLFAGGGLTNSVARGAGVLPKPTGVRPAQTHAARVLAEEGVPLDRAQREGGRFMQMLRSAVSNHPATAERAAQFSATQQKAFNRAVLRSIGENADEATQAVMSSARSRIGEVFDDIGRSGVRFDNSLQDDLARVVEDARRLVPDSEMGPLLRNVDDLMSAVDDTGKIPGQIFNRIRSRLSALSTRPGVGQSAREVESSLLDALERARPGQRAALQAARDQWRNLRIIEPTIAKDTSGNISPRLLSNQLGTRRNTNMSVYGRGGDQRLVELGRSGREVLPEQLPDSGTIPRGLMQAPIRSIVTAPLYRGAQSYLMAPARDPGANSLAYGARIPAIENALRDR